MKEKLLIAVDTIMCVPVVMFILAATAVSLAVTVFKGMKQLAKYGFR